MNTLNEDKFILEFSPSMNSNLIVKENEVFSLKTKDCFSNKVNCDSKTLGSITSHDLNPATGPVFVEGAKKGDLLKVQVLDIKVNDQGIIGTIFDSGIFCKHLEAKSIIRTIDIIDNEYFIFNGVKIPIDPMIGVIGVAPSEEDGSFPTEVPWKHGGNMDTKHIRKGSTMYFPVNTDGGLLAVGDLHALMADGEISLGLEIAGEVTLKAEIIKNKHIEWPIVETDNKIMILASGKDLEEATYNAAKEGVDYIAKVFNTDFEDAYALGSLILDMEISQLVNDKHTARATLDKSIVKISDLISKL